MVGTGVEGYGHQDTLVYTLGFGTVAAAFADVFTLSSVWQLVADFFRRIVCWYFETKLQFWGRWKEKCLFF